MNEFLCACSLWFDFRLTSGTLDLSHEKALSSEHLRSSLTDFSPSSLLMTSRASRYSQTWERIPRWCFQNVLRYSVRACVLA